MPRKQTELRRVMEMHKITANEVSQMIYRRVSTVVTWMHHQETEIPKELLELLKYKLKYEPIK